MKKIDLLVSRRELEVIHSCLNFVHKYCNDKDMLKLKDSSTCIKGLINDLNGIKYRLTELEKENLTKIDELLDKRPVKSS